MSKELLWQRGGARMVLQLAEARGTLHFCLRVTMEQHDGASSDRAATVKVAHVALCCCIGTWSAPMPTRRTPVRGHASCPCRCRLLLLPASICFDDNQLNALRNSHRAVHSPQTRTETHPNARSTRRAHHPGSTGDSGEIEGAI
jgi:hypothetical protein